MRFPATIVFLLYLLMAFSGYSMPDTHKKYSVSGMVTAKNDGESLVGATVFILELKTGTTTDQYGRFSITMVPGQYTLSFTFIGYTAITRAVNLDKDINLKVELETEQKELQEVFQKS